MICVSNRVESNLNQSNSMGYQYQLHLFFCISCLHENFVLFRNRFCFENDISCCSICIAWTRAKKMEDNWNDHIAFDLTHSHAHCLFLSHSLTYSFTLLNELPSHISPPPPLPFFLCVLAIHSLTDLLHNVICIVLFMSSRDSK